jgi:zinc protease
VDYPHREQAIVEGLTVHAVRDLARRHVRPDAMTYVIVGDAETQAARLKELGLGEPVMIKDALGRIDR